jgi:[acyl-carrier-protein] S-malonyltransferase
MATEPTLKERLPKSAFAFRGYNVTNLGRTRELLEHPAYSTIVEKHVTQVGQLYEDVTHRKTDLFEIIRSGVEPKLEGYGEAICLVVAAELAQLDILKECFGVEFTDANCSLGYSLGEITALVASSVYPVESVLHPILALADECVDLARDVRMGVVFSRGPLLDTEAVSKLCVEITAEGNGTICISSFLSPNTVLVLAQHETLSVLKTALKENFPREVHLKRNPDRWPPIHTAIVRQRNVSDRAGVILERVAGGMSEPTIPLVSCVTGSASYNSFNSRETLYNWVDQPQQLWKVIEYLLNSEVDTLIHVGPEPNIIPATFKRLSMNITSQLNRKNLAGFGLRAVSSIVRGRPWLAQYISKNAWLLKAPLIEHVVLEDLLLENSPE